MEEKKRYGFTTNNDGLSVLYDYELNKEFGTDSEIINLLNQQSKRIKELELLFNADKKMKTNSIKGFEKLKQENQKLKQTQKQLAIEELNKTKSCCEKFADELYDNLVDTALPTDIDKPKREAMKFLYLVSEFIDDQIKKLKGENTTIKCSLCGREMVKLADGVNYCCNHCHTQTLIYVNDIGEK